MSKNLFLRHINCPRSCRYARERCKTPDISLLHGGNFTLPPPPLSFLPPFGVFFFFFFLNASYHFCQALGRLVLLVPEGERSESAKPSQSDHIVPALFLILRILSKAQSPDIHAALCVCVCILQRVCVCA